MQSQKQKSQKILRGKEKIIRFMDVSEQVFLELLDLGLPVLRMNGHYYSHTDSIEEFIKKITSGTSNDKN